MKMDFVADGTVMYVRSSRSSRFGSLPGGAEWMALDLAFGDKLDTSVLTNVDAKGELALLEAVGDDVQKLGTEAASVAENDGVPVQVEAWIDADGLVRRMRLVRSQPTEEGKGPTTIDMRMDFFDFGFEPETRCRTRVKPSTPQGWPGRALASTTSVGPRLRPNWVTCH